MPIRPRKPCVVPLCPGLTRTKYCDAHAHLEARDLKERDSQRGSAVERGYDWRWHKYRNWYLRRHPLCVVCGRPADMVDHIVPLAQGGAMWDEENHQSMCWKDHGIKSAKDKAEGGAVESLPPDRS